MDRQLYIAAREGSIQDLTTILQCNSSLLPGSVTPQKNTALHIAVRYGQEEFVGKIIELQRLLLYQPNSKGDTPLHMAAKAGDLKLTQLLTKNKVVNDEDLERGGASSSWKMKNSDGNTAFHEALKKGHQEVALHLLGLDEKEHEKLERDVNNAGESPLFLAAEAGLEDVVVKIMEAADYSSAGPNRQTPLHIAVIKHHQGIVEVLLKGDSNGALVKKVDGNQKTALHYAATLGYHRITHLLLDADRSLAYIPDKESNSPLLLATISGRRRTVGKILYYCPDSTDLVDGNGRNALHLAVMNDRRIMLKCLLQKLEFVKLINEVDNDGNTPLHLATKNRNVATVRLLLKCKGVDFAAMNKEGFTARDVCEFDKGQAIRQKHIHKSFIQCGAPRGRYPWMERMPLRLRDPMIHPKADLKSVAKTLSVLAALVATVTFAAAFTIPGGYNNDGPNEGYSVLIKNTALKAFVISDALAFCSSMITAFLLIWAMLGDPVFLTNAVNLGLYISWVAVIAAVAAFTTGVYVVVSKESLGLAIVVLLMGCSVPPLIRWCFTYSVVITMVPPKLHRDVGKFKSISL